ncbi:cytochrome C oxidase subunit IV family protein [Mycobacterium yunnanensis]|uniref:Cytochrome C oxidase subunit IV family protein n=1 Tax=Mycobacterium yunnanensis TaxID=368477 RepID=A0A9X2Z4A3_9MYCO|nr:cytochrome C oxidase subunit IV family protein [Mycobacterium yunnanensis]MCV7423123.1 cytochrome C oxidase subunit IV family protein [Mycobacterium yunnanensis]
MSDTQRITATWIALSVVTIITWVLGHVERGFDERSTAVVALVVLAIAFGKVWLIIRHFMDVRSAPRWLKVFTDVWLLVLGVSVVSLYLA